MKPQWTDTLKCLFFPVASSENYGEYQNVTRFLDLIPQDTLAVASFRSKAYTRAVMHFESFITEKKQNIQEHLGFLQVLNSFFGSILKLKWTVMNGA